VGGEEGGGRWEGRWEGGGGMWDVGGVRSEEGDGSGGVASGINFSGL